MVRGWSPWLPRRVEVKNGTSFSGRPDRIHRPDSPGRDRFFRHRNRIFLPGEGRDVPEGPLYRGGTDAPGRRTAQNPAQTAPRWPASPRRGPPGPPPRAPEMRRGRRSLRLPRARRRNGPGQALGLTEQGAAQGPPEAIGSASETRAHPLAPAAPAGQAHGPVYFAFATWQDSRRVGVTRAVSRPPEALPGDPDPSLVAAFPGPSDRRPYRRRSVDASAIQPDRRHLARAYPLEGAAGPRRRWFPDTTA